MTGRILYEVTVTIEPQAREDYLAWLKPHVREILKLDGFLDAAIWIDSEDPCAITSAYIVRDRAAMDAYLAGPAAAFRADGVERFGDKMSAKRRMLERIDL